MAVVMAVVVLVRMGAAVVSVLVCWDGLELWVALVRVVEGGKCEELK
jgi:hypothetical protein